MATERITNGTFDTDTSGWTEIENSGRGLGQGPPANGTVGWTALTGGCGQVASGFGAGVSYDGVLYQPIGALYAGFTYQLSFRLFRRTAGTVQSDDSNAASIWISFNAADPILVAMVHTSPLTWAGKYGEPGPFQPSPLLVAQDVPINTDVLYEGSVDISHFVTYYGSGSYDLWLSGVFTNSSTSGSNRNQARFDTVSLLDFANPGPDVVPTTTRSVVVAVSESLAVSC